MKGQVHLYLNEKLLKKIPINHLGFKREIIINKSIEKFGDNDPCIIHETSCRNYLSMELMDKIENKYAEIVGRTLSIEELPEEIKNIIETPPEVNRLKFI